MKLIDVQDNRLFLPLADPRISTKQQPRLSSRSNRKLQDNVSFRTRRPAVLLRSYCTISVRDCATVAFPVVAVTVSV
jgi:hypothetical protein